MRSVENNNNKNINNSNKMIAAEADRHDLKPGNSTDPFLLRMQICEELKKHDKYRRGMISAASFSESLEALGLRFGHDRVTDILRFCTITEDGYVHYKDLIKHTSPEEPKAKTMTPNTVFPSTNDYNTAEIDEGVDELGAHNPAAAREFISQKTAGIQRLYSRWDRGLISTQDFVDGLKSMQIPLSREFDKVMQIHAPSRNLNFAQLMSALQIEDFMYRKARQPIMSPLIDDPSAKSSRPSSVRNPVTWSQHEGTNPFQAPTHRSLTVPEQNLERGEKRDRAQRMICDFCDGITNSTVFVAQLEALDVPISMEIKRLIRLHDSGNNTRFKDFAALILKDMCDDEPPPNAFPRYDIPVRRCYSPITARSNANPDVQNTHRSSVPYATDQAEALTKPAPAAIPPVVPRIPLNRNSAVIETDAGLRARNGNSAALGGDDSQYMHSPSCPIASPQSLVPTSSPHQSIDKVGNAMSHRTERTSYSNAEAMGGARYSTELNYSKDMTGLASPDTRTPIDSGAIYGHSKYTEEVKRSQNSRGHLGCITRGSGDIIGWNTSKADEKTSGTHLDTAPSSRDAGAPLENTAAALDRPSTAHSLNRGSGNIINWSRSPYGTNVDQPTKSRAGKTCFDEQKVFRAPFGTDKDVVQVYRRKLG